MTYEEALRKAKACLRLAESSNTHEAALAAAKAQEIMSRYNISIQAAQMETSHSMTEEEIQDFHLDPVITACQKDKNWTLRLTVIVAEANGCKTYYRPRCGGSASFLIGRPADVQTARYMIGLLAEAVRRLGRIHTQGYSDKYRRDFKYGVVEAIKHKFDTVWKKTKEDVKAEQTNPMALARIDQAIAKIENQVAKVEAWTKAHRDFKPGRTSKFKLTADARHRGFMAGQTIEVNRARGGVGNGVTGMIQG